MPRYVLTIWDPESPEAASSEQFQKMVEAYGPFTEELQSKGVMVAGEGLQPSSATTTVRVKNGDTLTTDGPFAETKEQISGFYVLDCKDLDEAIEWAARIPSAAMGFGTIEVRPAIEVPA